ncbi:ribosome hibernation-promoting factor, HPF/YfiA family [Novosphingobium terrae]|jgi:ribosomal subunit interface protein|uniref:ribosome hibernation-promoting factor, HPF/YfiA family n=1 Tax=Novosphingobium terrae TaxID=2726189 RepID=UPI00197F8D53|nr:ribosome-associated translation inhibitor RaiA [Novosphingobium terrae]
MDIRVSGHQMETGEALRVHVEDRLNTITDKHFNKALSSVVTFGKAPGGSFRCDIVTHVRQGLILKGAGIAHDAHQSLDAAAIKIETQLRRYKKRLNDRHEQSTHAVQTQEAAYTIFEEPVHEEGEEAVAEAPLVIAELRVDVPEATVSDAVMMLDLRNTNALLFKNAGTGKHNMVYRRGDGSIGWVEPS